MKTTQATLRRGWGKTLIMVLLGMATSSDSARAGMPILSVDVGAIPLLPDTPEQTVELFVHNEASTAFRATGLSLRLEVDDGLGGGNAPFITGVDAVTGTPWVGQLGSVTVTAQQPEYWDIHIFSDFFAGKYAELPAGSLTRLAMITLDTTGLTAGSWPLRLASSNGGVTKYNDADSFGNEVPLAVNPGTLTIVPEPRRTASVALCCILVWVMVKRRGQRSELCS